MKRDGMAVVFGRKNLEESSRYFFYLSFWGEAGHKCSSSIASVVFLYEANGGIDNEQ